jgi:hypothetical protein
MSKTSFNRLYVIERFASLCCVLMECLMAGLKDLIFTLRTDAEKNLVDFALNAETNDVLVYATSTFVKPFNLMALARECAALGYVRLSLKRVGKDVHYLAVKRKLAETEVD